MLGTAWRSRASRSQGSSLRKRSATSYVAPPQASRLSSSGVIRETWPDTASRSRVRTRVASSDWCASRKVVSVTPTRCWPRRSAANFSGPSWSSACREPSGAGTLEVDLGQLADGVDADRRLAVRLVDGHLGQPGEQSGAAVGVGPCLEQVGVLLDEAGRHVARAEVGLVEERDQERDVRRDATDPELGDSSAGLADGVLEGAAATGELGEHRVEVRGDLGAGVRRTAVEADAATAGGAVRRDPAGVRTEAVGGVLGGDPALQRRTAQPDRVLAQAEVLQGLAGGDPHLRLHQVDLGDLLGHGVLDLDPRVHLDEDVVALGVEQELHGAGVAVADLLGEPHRVGAHPLAELGVEVGRRRDLDHLLVTSLHRAVALEEVDHVALAVGEDLHLDVPRVDHGLLDEHRRVAERALGLAHAGVDRVLEVLLLVDLAHAAAATAGDGLHEERVGQLLGGLHQLVEVVVGRHRVQRRYAGLLGRRDRPGLVAGELEHLGGRPDEGDARVGARLGEVGVLREEPVARVDGVRTGLDRHLDDRLGVQVGAHRVADLADLVGLVGLHPVLGPAVLVGEDRHRARAHLRRRAERPDRDLASVGHQDLGEHGSRLVRPGHVRVTSSRGGKAHGMGLKGRSGAYSEVTLGHDHLDERPRGVPAAATAVAGAQPATLRRHPAGRAGAAGGGRVRVVHLRAGGAAGRGADRVAVPVLRQQVRHHLRARPARHRQRAGRAGEVRGRDPQPGLARAAREAARPPRGALAHRPVEAGGVAGDAGDAADAGDRRRARARPRLRR